MELIEAKVTVCSVDERGVLALDFETPGKTHWCLFLPRIRLPFEHAEKSIAHVLARVAQVNFVLILSEDLKSFRPSSDDVERLS